MTEYLFYGYLVVFWFALAAITFVTILFIPAPYGRFTRRGWGLRLNPRLGWVLMELSAALCFLVLYLLGNHRDQPASVLLLAFWMAHYVYRSLVYPFSIRGNRRQTTLITGETGYRIPYAGAYRYVSCPNYLGEMVQSGGWALACWSIGGLAFFVWTVANLAPRALSTHRWYRNTFQDYANDRRALVPFVV